MTHFVLQTCLLLFGAFIIGAALACILRSLFHKPAAPRDAVDKARRAPADLPSAVATGTAASSEDAAQPTAADETPTTGGDPEPAHAEKATTEDTDSSALSGAAAVAGATMAGAGALADAQGAAKPAEDEGERARPAEPEQSDDSAEPGEAATLSGAPEGVDTADTPAENALADAATRSEPEGFAEPASGPEVQPHVDSGPQDSGKPVPYAGFVGAGAVAPEDDLTDIRGIDADMAHRLNDLGVNRFAQLAEMSRADVDALEGTLGETGRVSRQNWIEQAAILAAGGATVHAILRRQHTGANSAAPHAAAPDRPGGVLTGIAVDPEDDLTRIDGIDADLAAWLNTLGVNRYQQIAGLTADDVAQLNADLGGEETVSRRNWIEQAAVLASGGSTLFALKRDWSGQEASGGGEGGADAIPDTVSAPEELAVGGAEQTEVTQSGEASVETTPVPLSEGTEAERASEADDAAAHNAHHDDPSGGAAPEPDEYEEDDVKSSAAAAAAVVVGAALAAGRGAREGDGDEHPVKTSMVLSRSGQQAAADAQAPAAASASSGGPDDLTRIRGLGDDDQARLNELGVTRHAEVAAWSAEDVAGAGEAVGGARRIAREGWIEQAAMLVTGATTLFAARKDAGLVVRSVTQPPHQAHSAPRSDNESAPSIQEATSSPAPARSVDDLPKAASPGGVVAATSLPSRVTAAAADPSEAGQVSGDEAVEAPLSEEAEATGGARGDVSALRSVRSEALTGQRASGGPVVGAKEADDLKRIRGIGVLVEKKLHSLGVTRYADIAGWTPEDIARISQALGFRGRIERENWVEQANILTHEGQTEFSRRFDRGEVGGSNDGQR